jgi:hypothetical protein
VLDEVNHNAKVHQWIENHRNRIPTFADKADLYRYVNNDACKGSAIDFLEFGVYKGESIHAWAGINRDPLSRFLGFDSFEGLPEDWNPSNPAGTFTLGGQAPATEDRRIEFIKGWFQQTLRETMSRFKPRSTLVVHNDSDLYSSTLFVLSVLDPVLVRGSILLFDEFSSPLHEFRAFHDYVNAYQRTTEVLGMTADYGSQVAFRISN